MSEAVGALERVTPRRIIGWAVLGGEPATPAQVAVQVNGKEIAVIEANRHRPDIRRAGLHPTGECGFVLTLPEDLRLQPGDLVSARVIGADSDLAGSPMACAARAGEAATAGSLSSDLPGMRRRSGDRVPPPPRIPPVLGRSSFRIFLDSLRAFFMRELRVKYGAERMGYFWAVAQPVAFILLLRYARGIASGGMSGDMYGVSPLYFFMLAVIPFFMFQQGLNRAMGAIRDFRGLFNYPQARPIDVVIVRVTIQFLLMLVVLLILSIGYWWFDVDMEAEEPLQFAAVILLLYLTALGLGLLADVYITTNRDLQRVFRLMERPMFFISAIFFTMEDLPDEILPYLIWNPIMHAIDLARGAMLSDYDSPGSWLFVAMFAIVALMLGLAAYRRRLQALIGAEE